MKTLPRIAQLYVSVVIIVGGSLLVSALWSLDWLQQSMLFLVLLLVSAVVSVFAVAVPIARGGSTISVSYAVDILCLLLLGPRPTMIVAAASAWSQCTYGISQKNPRYQTFFSMAAVVIGVRIASTTSVLLGGALPVVTPTFPDIAKPLAGLALAHFTSNTALVATAIALTTRQSVIAVWKHNFSWSAVSYLVGAATAACVTVAVKSADVNYWTAMFAVAPLYLIYRSYRSYLGRISDQQRQDIVLGLVGLSGHVESISELSRMVMQQLGAALHPATSYFWFRDGSEFSLVFSSDSRTIPMVCPDSNAVIAHLEQTGTLLDTSSLNQGLSPVACRWLSELGVRLVVPSIGSNQRVIAMLMFGERSLAEPYSAGDLRLLKTVAKEITVVIENMRLAAQLGEEQRIRHQVLSKIDRALVGYMMECPLCGICFDSRVEHCDRDGHALLPSLPIQRTVDGKYRLDRLLGKGAMGAVYEGRDLRLDRPVAVKVMTRDFRQGQSVRRFHREARAVASLNHPNIVSVYDYGTIEPATAYMVMECVPGITLRKELNRSGALTPVHAVDWFDQVLRGVAAAHDQGIVHRDLKPENIIGHRDRGGLSVKILDFGLAKFQPREDAETTAGTQTVPGVVMGTFGYMSPEQLLGAPLDTRADLFSVGVMIVEALTGSRPFRGETYNDVLRAIAGEPYHLPSTLAEMSALDALLQRCLAKEPSDRPASAAALLQELVPALIGSPSVLRIPN